MMMQFVCTARSADDEDYRPLAETPLTLDFAYDHGAVVIGKVQRQRRFNFGRSGGLAGDADQQRRCPMARRC